MKFFYCDDFVLPLPDGHRFPMRKYSRLRERILTEIDPLAGVMTMPDGVTEAQILRCHTAEYVHKVRHGFLTEREVRRIGFPWSPELFERAKHSSGGTLGACLEALKSGTSMNLAGGTHHACPDHGEGFCVFNDTAIAARALQDMGLVQNVVVLDCDVHQGNGTAAICADDPTIFTLSIHGEKNFPFRKVPGDLDIGLPDGTGDDDYMEHLRRGVAYALDRANADIAIFIAGADVYAGDRLGKLSLTKAGIAERDRTVFQMCYERGLPVAVVMGGGYAPDVEDIAGIHFQTAQIVTEMADVWQRQHAR
jgi:acetoin utilization deacetylase AcuC-like enzyme